MLYFERFELSFSIILISFSANLNKSSFIIGSANLKVFCPLCWKPKRSPYPRNFKSSSAIKNPSFEFFKILILFIAFLLRPSLNNSMQVPCSTPLPTLPLNWCNWANPNLLAFSIIIKLAFGKSIPTSITVVETRIDIFCNKNFLIIVCQYLFRLL